ncbi:MAG: MurR/RpiR family transcriptional regulator [Trueperaceae bacterium]
MKGRRPSPGPPSGAVLARIRGLESSLTRSESAVAGAILADTDEIVGLSVVALADRTGVSTATVMRLCRALGFSGFREFKIALAYERGGAAAAALEVELRLGDKPAQIMRKVVQAEIQALKETLELVDERQLDEAVAALAAAGRIEIYGMGSSTPVVVDAYYRFLRVGLRVSTPPDSHMQSVSAALLGAGDVALVVSHTGRTQEVLTAAQKAKDAGATIIALTSFFRSPLLQLANIELVTAVQETTSRVEAMSSRTAHLAIVDSLYVALSMQRQETSKKALSKTQSSIDSQRVE